MKRLIVLFLIMSSLSLSAQEKKGEVNFLVEVDNGYFEILIDDSIFLKLYKTELIPGLHKAKVWSPGYLTADIEFEVEEGEKVAVNVPMVVSNERQNYERNYKEYRMHFHKHLTIPLTVTLAASLTTTTYMIYAYRAKNRVQENMELYNYSPNYNDVIRYKGLAEVNNTKYNRLRVGFYTSLTITGLSIATTIYTYRKFKKTYTEPQLNSESPFKDKFSFTPTPFGFHLSYKIG